MMEGMAPRPHKDSCRTRMEDHLEKEENPRWKRAADAKEDKFWEARQEEEDKMEKGKVDENKVEETMVDEPKIEDQIDSSTEVPLREPVAPRSGWPTQGHNPGSRKAEDTGGTGSSND